MSDTEKLESLDEHGQPIAAPSAYSPFGAIVLVFLALVIGYSIQLGSLWNQYQQNKQAQTALVEMLPQVKAVNAKLQKVSQELIQMSATSAPAKQIVAEFNIQQK